MNYSRTPVCLWSYWKAGKEVHYVQTWCCLREWSIWVFEANTPQTSCSMMSSVSSACFPCSCLCRMSVVLPNGIDLSLKPFCSECIYSLSLYCPVAFSPRYAILEIASPLQSVITFGHWVQVLLQGIDRQHDCISPTSRRNKEKNPPERTKRRKKTSIRKPQCIQWLKSEPFQATST